MGQTMAMAIMTGGLPKMH